MPGVDIRVTLTGDKEIYNILRRLSRMGQDRSALYDRWGLQVLNWVDRQFQSQGGQGGTPWPRLSPNTIAARRGGSSQILQDTGRLKSSFTHTLTGRGVSVGTNVEYASFHQFGTKGPYEIKPKRALALAFKTAGGGRRVQASFSSRATKATYKKGDKYVIVKSVMHPGLPVRAMLPDAQQITPILLRTARNYIAELIGKR